MSNHHLVASERERVFATKSFNSLSQALLASAFKSSFKLENHTLLTQVLCQSMLSSDAKVLFCATMGASGSVPYLKHCITALKFAQKIREAI